MPARGSKQEIVVQSDRDLLAPNYLEIGKEEELDNEEKGARKMTRPPVARINQVQQNLT